jgi:hypothetical protein
MLEYNIIKSVCISPQDFRETEDGKLMNWLIHYGKHMNNYTVPLIELSFNYCRGAA